MKKELVLDCVTANEDNFSWKEVNCFHRPFATVFKTFNEEYYDGYLLFVSLFSGYMTRSLEYNKFYLDNYNLLLKDKFEIEIEDEYFTNKEELISYVKKSIDLGIPVITHVDIFELIYNPMYKREHSLKDIIIKGYDMERKLFYILDNSHIDQGSSTVLSDFVCKYEDMYMMCKSKKNILNEDKMFFTKVIKKSEKVFDIYSMLLYLKEILIKIQNEKLCISYPEIELIKSRDSEINENDVQPIFLLSNFKAVFFEILLRKMKKYQYCNEIYKEVESISKDVLNTWNNIKIKTLYLSSNGENGKVELLETANKNVEKEKILRSKIICLIDSINVLPQKLNDRIDSFFIENRKKAVIKKNENQIIVKHLDRCIYDTWTRQDDAVQFLRYDIENIKYIETKVEFNGKVGNSFSCGIIIKYRNGDKILFENTSGTNINIYCPSFGDKFEIYDELCLDPRRSCCFRVEIDDKNINFLLLNSDYTGFDITKQIPNNSEIKSIGLFSKTWIKIDNMVKFYDYKIG